MRIKTSAFQKAIFIFRKISSSLWLSSFCTKIDFFFDYPVFSDVQNFLSKMFGPLCSVFMIFSFQMYRIFFRKCLGPRYSVFVDILFSDVQNFLSKMFGPPRYCVFIDIQFSEWIFYRRANSAMSVRFLKKVMPSQLFKKRNFLKYLRHLRIIDFDQPISIDHVIGSIRF